MTRTVLKGVLAGLMLLYGPAQAQPAPKLPWARSYQEAVGRARKTNGLVMVDFYTDWCTWCKRLDQDTYTNRAVIQAAVPFVPVKLNAEKEGKALAARHGVTSYPSIVFINTAGEVEARIDGYMGPAPFAAELKRIAGEHAEFPRLQARLRSHPTDREAAARLAQLYAARGNATQAAATLAKAEKGGAVGRSLIAAYLAVGNLFASRGEFPQAAEYFRRAAARGKDPADVAAARMRLAMCYAQQRKLAETRRELQAVAALPGAPAQVRQQARDILLKLPAASGR